MTAAKRRTPGKVIPLTSPYLYVEARAYPNSWKVAADGTVHNDNPISFDSIVVQARSEEDAYQLGAAQLQTRQQQEETDYIDDGDGDRDLTQLHSQQFFLNDYVVKL